MSQGVVCLTSPRMSKIDPDRPDLACQGHGLAQKWDFWSKMPKSEKPLRWSNYKARIHWETAQTGPQVTKMPFRVQNDMTQGVVRCQTWSKTAIFHEKSPKITVFPLFAKKWKNVIFEQICVYSRVTESTSDGLKNVKSRVQNLKTRFFRVFFDI